MAEKRSSEESKKYIIAKMLSREEIEEIVDEIALARDLSMGEIAEIAESIAPGQDGVKAFLLEIRGTFFIDDHILRAWADRLERLLQ